MIHEIFRTTTLYKEPDPTPELAEYYQLTVLELAGQTYAVTEKHGWWDEEKQKAIFHSVMLDDREFPSLLDALKRHDEHVSKLVKNGFPFQAYLDFSDGLPDVAWRNLTDI